MLGFAPMKTNSPRTASVDAPADCLHEFHALELIRPSNAATCVCGVTMIRGARDLVDQVARHGGLQCLAPNDDVDFGAAAAQEQRGLACRVSAANDGDRARAAGLRLHLSGGVVDADAFELGDPVQREAVIAAPVAMMTDFAVITSPSSNVTRCRDTFRG